MLEVMIVMAIIAAGAILVRSGFRMITRADLVEDATELAAIMRRASQLAIEHGELHRVVMDLDKQVYVVEVCQGATAIQRNELLRPDEDAKKRAMDRAKDKLRTLPTDALAAGDPEEATRRATALSGHHIADRTCVPATDSVVGTVAGSVDDKDDKWKQKNASWSRGLRAAKGIKFKEIWVQHRDDSVTKGQIAVYFFPLGNAEKSVVELTDGSETYSVLVYGLTGRVELRDGVLRDVNDHMMRNVMGDKDAKRETDR